MTLTNQMVTAVTTDDAAAVARLLDAGADIDAINDQREAAFSYACANNAFEVAQLLHARGADINTVDTGWWLTFGLGSLLVVARVSHLAAVGRRRPSRWLVRREGLATPRHHGHHITSRCCGRARTRLVQLLSYACRRVRCSPQSVIRHVLPADRR